MQLKLKHIIRLLTTFKVVIMDTPSVFLEDVIREVDGIVEIDILYIFQGIHDDIIYIDENIDNVSCEILLNETHGFLSNIYDFLNETYDEITKSDKEGNLKVRDNLTFHTQASGSKYSDSRKKTGEFLKYVPVYVQISFSSNTEETVDEQKNIDFIKPIGYNKISQYINEYEKCFDDTLLSHGKSFDDILNSINQSFFEKHRINLFPPFFNESEKQRYSKIIKLFIIMELESCDLDYKFLPKIDENNIEEKQIRNNLNPFIAQLLYINKIEFLIYTQEETSVKTTPKPKSQNTFLSADLFYLKNIVKTLYFNIDVYLIKHTPPPTQFQTFQEVAGFLGVNNENQTTSSTVPTKSTGVSATIPTPECSGTSSENPILSSSIHEELTLETPNLDKITKVGLLEDLKELLTYLLVMFFNEIKDNIEGYGFIETSNSNAFFSDAIISQFEFLFTKYHIPKPQNEEPPHWTIPNHHWYNNHTKKLFYGKMENFCKWRHNQIFKVIDNYSKDFQATKDTSYEKISEKYFIFKEKIIKYFELNNLKIKFTNDLSIFSGQNKENEQEESEEESFYSENEYTDEDSIQEEYEVANEEDISQLKTIPEDSIESKDIDGIVVKDTKETENSKSEEENSKSEEENSKSEEENSNSEEEVDDENVIYIFDLKKKMAGNKVENGDIFDFIIKNTIFISSCYYAIISNPVTDFQ